MAYIYFQAGKVNPVPNGESQNPVPGYTSQMLTDNSRLSGVPLVPVKGPLVDCTGLEWPRRVEAVTAGEEAAARSPNVAGTAAK